MIKKANNNQTKKAEITLKLKVVHYQANHYYHGIFNPPPNP